MPYYRIQKHDNEIKKCPECRADKMHFHNHLASWICANCSNRVREDFFQTVLPSNRELEADEIQPDNNMTQAGNSFFIKSFEPGSNDYNYEESVNLGVLGKHNNDYNNDDRKYRGSAQSAVKQDLAKFHQKLECDKRIVRQHKQQQYSNIIGNDSQETELNKFRQRQIRDRENRL